MTGNEYFLDWHWWKWTHVTHHRVVLSGFYPKALTILTRGNPLVSFNVGDVKGRCGQEEEEDICVVLTRSNLIIDFTG